MSLVVLKYAGLGLTGLVGIGAAVVFGMHSSSSSSNLWDHDEQWQFLYIFSKKIFEKSKENEGSDLSTNPKDNVIQWLKDKFSGSIENTDDTWQNFKSLCETQKIKETKSGRDVDNEYSRLCFIDSVDSAKGSLKNWHNKEEPKIGDNENEVFSGVKNNYDLWKEFKQKYPTGDIIDKFNEWSNDTESSSGIDFLIGL